MRVLWSIFICILLFLPISMGKSLPHIPVVNKPFNANRFIPQGNYSGLVKLADSLYAVVNDKSEKAGFLLLQIRFDQVSGQIQHIRQVKFVNCDREPSDLEDITFLPQSREILLADEADNSITRYDLAGKKTGSSFAFPAFFGSAKANLGLESLTYSSNTQSVWTCTESTLAYDSALLAAANIDTPCVRLLAFSPQGTLKAQYAYRLDTPQRSTTGRTHIQGVSALTALNNGKLLVLEREIYITRWGISSQVFTKIYCISPQVETAVGNEPLNARSPFVKKELVASITTSLGVFHQQFANYEGMCVGPQLADGRQVILLVADSQNRYKRVLKDWFNTLVIPASFTN